MRSIEIQILCEPLDVMSNENGEAVWTERDPSPEEVAVVVKNARVAERNKILDKAMDSVIGIPANKEQRQALRQAYEVLRLLKRRDEV